MDARRPYRATMFWAAGYASFGAICALKDLPVFYRGPDPAPSAWGWVAVAVGALATLGCAAMSRYGPRPLLRVLMWTACGLAAIAAFGLLMDVITLVFGEGVDSWVAAANHALAAIGAALLATVARPAPERPSRGESDVMLSADAHLLVSRPVQVAALAGTGAFLPYIAMKLIWALGGTFAGMDGAQMRAVAERNGASGIWLTLESWGLDGTALLAMLGVFLLWGLVRPWGQIFPRWLPLLHGQRVPRWLPLSPAVIGAATLAPYGVLGLGYCTLAAFGVVTMPRGDFENSGDTLQVAWIGMVAFAGFGVALAIAARSYWRRTRA